MCLFLSEVAFHEMIVVSPEDIKALYISLIVHLLMHLQPILDPSY